MFDPKNFPNMLPYLRITHRDVENWCEYYPLEILPKDKYYDDFIENIKGFPTMVYPFYSHILKSEKQQMPFQHEYYETYLKYHAKMETNFDFEFSGYSDVQKMIYKNAVMGRVYRTYPSLVRDLHFALYLKNKLGDNAVFNRQLDVYKGVDIMLIIKNKYYGIKLFTKTERAEEFKRIKDSHRQKDFSNVEYIPITKSLKGDYFGSFYLFGDDEFNEHIAPLI